MPRYVFDEVRSALHACWGLGIYRGGAGGGDGEHDGRWTVEYSKTGYIVHGNMPGIGHSYRRFASLAAVVRTCDLEKAIRKQRENKPAK
jgi:hypothetical protein